MNYLKQSHAWFLAQSMQRRLTFIGGIVFIAILSTCLVIWAISPTYGVLFNHLDPRDANHVLQQLDEAHIAYQVHNQGADILIDKQLIDKTRIQLMGSDVQFTHSVGFELFDKTDFGMTDFSQKVNYQRALQGELERTINSLDEVKQARVQLTIPESHLFQQENNLPRVAITLHLNRPLTPLQVKSIQQLITASVANLPLKNVVIVDENGNGLIANDDDTSTGHFSAKKKIERYLNEKVMQMLHQIFTDGNVMVKIDATLNYDEFIRERVKPQHDGLITHEKETRHSTTNTSEKKPTNQDFTREKSYQLGREKEQFTRANGTIERLTISVVLPQKTSRDMRAQVERLVKSVVGFNGTRGDSISVEALSVTPKPIAIRPTTTAPSVFSTSLVMSCIAMLFVFSLMTLLRKRRVRLKHRQRLLTELNLWLLEHDET